MTKNNGGNLFQNKMSIVTYNTCKINEIEQLGYDVYTLFSSIYINMNVGHAILES